MTIDSYFMQIKLKKLTNLIKPVYKSDLRKSYYNTINIIQDYPTLLSLISDFRINRLTDNYTQKAIEPYSLQLGSSRYSEAIRILKSNSYKPYTHKFNQDITSVFFKFRNGSLRVKTQMHFYQGTLFLLKSEVTGGNYFEGLEEFWRNILLKYGNPSNRNNNVFIRDESDKMILIENNHFAVFTTYLSPEVEQCEAFLKSLQPKLQIQESKTSLDYAF